MNKLACTTAKSSILLLVLPFLCSVALVNCEGKETGDKQSRADLFPKEHWLQ